MQPRRKRALAKEIAVGISTMQCDFAAANAQKLSSKRIFLHSPNDAAFQSAQAGSVGLKFELSLLPRKMADCG